MLNENIIKEFQRLIAFKKSAKYFYSKVFNWHETATVYIKQIAIVAVAL